MTSTSTTTSTTITTRQAPKFKVGDKVRINANGPRLYWVHSMDRFKNKDVVGVVNSNQRYDRSVGYYLHKLEEFDCWSISEQDLELVEEAVPSPSPNANARKHADLIIAWAKGAKIEYSYNNIDWTYTDKPAWDINATYRIKPEEPIVVPVEFFMRINTSSSNPDSLNIRYGIQQTKAVNYNVKATVDKNTGKLLSIEML